MSRTKRKDSRVFLDEWLDGKYRQYDCTNDNAHNVKHWLYYCARQLGYRCSVMMWPDTNSVSFRCWKEEQ